jgi:ubiquinone/menaquinone biosynthesis C-methylase UbiE
MIAASDTEGRLRAFRERTLEYLRHGHDRLGAARFVVETAGGLRGPALDVGTGKGLLAIALARSGAEVISVDLVDDEQELARLLAEEAGVGGRIRFLRQDAAHLPYPDRGFGCAAMMDVLHHLDDPGPVLREMARVVDERGVIVVADFDEAGFELVARVHREEGRVHPRSAATVAAAEAELLAAGFHRLAWATGELHEVVVLSREPPRAPRAKLP